MTEDENIQRALARIAISKLNKVTKLGD